MSFAGIHGTFKSITADRVEAESGGTRIVHVDKPLDVTAARAKLKFLPRFRLSVENCHLAVRKAEQKHFAQAIKSHRNVWLVADWGAGKEGFLATALHQAGGDDRLTDVFRLQCGGIETCEQLVTEAETQLGMSFQEFLAAVAVLPSASIVFDDLSASIASGSQRAEFDKRCNRFLISAST